MSGSGAYGEMNEVALFETALRAAVPTRPDPRLGAALVPRLAEVARASTIDAETQATRQGAVRRRPRSRLALVARVGLAVALVPLVLAGLAFAGVTVPEPARSALDSVGITLPNQPASDDEGSTDGTGSDSSTGTNTQTGTTASESQGNSAAAHQHAREQRKKARGKAIGHTRGKAIGLNELTPPGQTQETGPPPHSNAGGSSSTHRAQPTPKVHPTPLPRGNAKGRFK